LRNRAICGLIFQVVDLAIEASQAVKTFVVSLLLGVGIETALIAALVLGGIGPCGPASPVSGFVLLLHTPGLFLMNALHIPETIGLWSVAAVYAMLWSVVPMLLLRERS
jgi:hypothetical protein